MIYRQMHSPIGRLTLVEEQGALVYLCLPNDPLPIGAIQGDTPFLAQAVAQLEEYFAGERKAFSIPLAPIGTPFFQRAWQALVEIPCGQVRSYGEQATLLGGPRLARAVGLANARNPIPIFIPCHRLVGKNGSLTGFRGGIAQKEFLLRLEQAYPFMK